MTEVPLSIAEAAAALRSGRLSAVELTNATLRQADRHDAGTGVFLSRFDETAHATTAEADRELGTGDDRGPLHGIPWGSRTSSPRARDPRPRRAWWWTRRGSPAATP